MNLDTILETLKTYIADNPQITKAAIAAEIGVTRVELSQWLSGGERKPVADKAFQILKFLTKGTQPIMNTIQTDDGLQAVNEKILRKYAGKGMQIKHFTSGLGLNEGDGFVPGVNAEPDNADLLAQLVRDGRLDEAKDLLTQIQKGPRIQPSTAIKSQPNPFGSTRGTVAVVGGANGQRSTWINGQSFDANGGTLNVDENRAVVEFAKKDISKMYDQHVAKSHKTEVKELKVNKDTQINFSRANMQMVEDLHSEGTVFEEAKKLRAARERAFQVTKEREARLSAGKGTVADAVAKLNAMRA